MIGEYDDFFPTRPRGAVKRPQVKEAFKVKKEAIVVKQEVRANTSEFVTALKQVDISADLSMEFRRQSGLFSTWAYEHARAEDRVRELEEKLDLEFYILYAEYRGSHTDAKENDCKAYIHMSDTYISLQTKLRKAKLERDMYKAIVNAFSMRKDMLVQLGADSRKEFENTDVAMKARKATRAMKKALADQLEEEFDEPF